MRILLKVWSYGHCHRNWGVRVTVTVTVTVTLDWEGGCVFDVGQDDARRYFLDTWQLRKLFEEESFVRFDVLGDDP